MKRRLFLMLAVCGMLISLCGCADDTAPQTDATTTDVVFDMLYTDNVTDGEMVVFRSGDRYFNVSDMQDIENFPPSKELDDGKFAVIVADYNILNGDIAGYTGNAQILKLKSINKLDAEDALSRCGIRDYSKGCIDRMTPLVICRATGDDCLVLYDCGRYFVYNGEGLVGTYDDIAQSDGVEYLFISSFEHDRLHAGLEEDILSCGDYFVLSVAAEQTTAPDKNANLISSR